MTNDLNKFSSALSPSNFSSEHMSVVDKRRVLNDASAITREVARRNMVENGLAMIQTTALKNVLELSAYQDQATNIDTEIRIKFLLDEYTMRCNKRLGGM